MLRLTVVVSIHDTIEMLNVTEIFFMNEQWDFLFAHQNRCKTALQIRYLDVGNSKF